MRRVVIAASFGAIAMAVALVGLTAIPARIVDDPATDSYQRMREQEHAAIRCLRTIVQAQFQLKDLRSIDADADGVGEFGFLAELTGSVPLRDSGEMPEYLRPPLLCKHLGPAEEGWADCDGYLFQLYLPDADGRLVAEPRPGAAPASQIDTAQSERRFGCYAWPAHMGETGTRAFFVDQSGVLLSSDNQKARYSGSKQRPAAGAAFLPPEGDPPVSSPARGATGQDGQHWTIVR